jgi:DNA-binding NtrC family response regulator
MRKQPGIAGNPTETLTVLSVSPLEKDHLSLHAIIGHSTWRLFSAVGVPPALALLQGHEISVVLCERDLMPGTWIDMLENIKDLPHPPSLIVISRLADERLWSEALNLGAWDVLPKPFDRREVLRTVKSGWEHWHHQTHMRATAVKMITAGS